MLREKRLFSYYCVPIANKNRNAYNKEHVPLKRSDEKTVELPWLMQAAGVSLELDTVQRIYGLSFGLCCAQ